MKREKHLYVCFPLPTDNVGISYIALSIYRKMIKNGLKVSFVTPVVRRGIDKKNITQTLPLPFRFLPWKYVSKMAVAGYGNTVKKRCSRDAVVDLWSDNPTWLYDALRENNVTIVKEKFNCAQKIAYTILNNEYERIDSPSRCGITDSSIRHEMEQLEIADYIMSPSPMVKKTLIQVGVPQEKIIESSFGWEPGSNAAPSSYLANYKKPCFLFVGTVCIRKGAHLLLQYWKNAHIDGTLVFLGGVHSEMAPFVNEFQGRSDIVFLGHIEKAFSVYNECDIFCFPTLEEGGPLVTYEALSRGVASIVSPMGAGAAVRNGLEGLVIDPHNETEWIDGMRKLAADATLRSTMVIEGKRRVADFTWEKVALQRYRAIMERVL